MVAEEADASKYNKQSLFRWELSNNLEQLEFQLRLLSGLLYQLAQQLDVFDNNDIHILRSLGQVAEYMYDKEGDYLMLISPEYMPVVFKSRDKGWLKDPHEFANWLMVNWREESLVIVLS